VAGDTGCAGASSAGGLDARTTPPLPDPLAFRQDRRWLRRPRREWASARYLYSRENEDEAQQAKVLTVDEARRIAANIARLPDLLGKGGRD
jgi:hypothetical protein